MGTIYGFRYNHLHVFYRMAAQVYRNIRRNLLMVLPDFFPTAIWLPHSQVWAIIQVAPSPDINHFVFTYLTQRSLDAS